MLKKWICLQNFVQLLVKQQFDVQMTIYTVTINNSKETVSKVKNQMRLCN